MENFDAIVVTIGALLIATGVIIFVTGKVVSQNNKFEGFGIKVNLNNPSMVLVLVGAGMVLVPRLLPDPARINELPPPAAGIPSQTEIQESGSRYTMEPDTGDLTLVKVVPRAPQNITRDSTERFPFTPMAEIANQETTTPPSITGSFDLTSYRLDNRLQNTDGTMDIQPRGNNQYEWMVNLDTYDAFGSIISYYYSGTLYYANQGWRMQILASNDKSWVDVGEVPVNIVKQGDNLSFDYYYDGAKIDIVWESE